MTSFPSLLEATRPQDAQVVGDEVLGAAGDPGQVAPAQLPALLQRRRRHEPRRVGEHPRPLRSLPGRPNVEEALPDLLSPRGVYAQEITTLVHKFILTYVDTLVQPVSWLIVAGWEAEGLEGGVMVTYVVDLEGGVGDPELVGEDLFEVAAAGVAVLVPAY